MSRALISPKPLTGRKVLFMLLAFFGVVIGVNVDRDRDRAERFLDETPAEFSIVYDPKGELATAYKVAGMPSGILIDRAGHVRFQHAGFSEKQKGLNEEQLQTLLAEKTH